MKLALGLSATALGGALLCVALGAVLAMPLAGWLGARGLRRLMLGCGLLLAAALPLPGLAGGAAALGGTLLLFGALSGALDVWMNARAAELERRGGRAIMSSFHAAFSLGGLVGSGVMAAAGWAGLGVRAALAAMALLVTCMVLAHAALDRTPSPAPARRPGFVWPGWPLIGLGVLCLLAFMCEGAVADWSGVFLAQVAGFSVPAAASGYAAFSAAMVVGRLSGDAVVRRLGGGTVLRLGGLLAAAGFAVAIAAPWAGALGFGMVGLGASNMAPVLFSAAARAGAAASAGVAAVATLGYGGMLLGPPLVGVVADVAGMRWAIGALLAAMLAIAAAARRERSVAPRPAAP